MYFPLKLWMTQVYTSFIHATDSHGSCKACLLIYSMVISIHWSIFISPGAVSSKHAAALDHLPATWTGEETGRQPLCSAHSLGPQLQLRSYSTSGVYDDVIKWKHFSCYWPFVRGIHRSPLNSQHKGQWRGDLMLSLICAWINDWVNTGEAGDERRHRVHYEVTAMCYGVTATTWLKNHCHLKVFFLTWLPISMQQVYEPNRRQVRKSPLPSDKKTC